MNEQDIAAVSAANLSVLRAKTVRERQLLFEGDNISPWRG
jgi:hypothetical protein